MKNPKDDQESEKIVNDFAKGAKPERALDNYPESSTTKTSFSIRRTIARILIAISFFIITGIAFIIWIVVGQLGGGTRGEIALSGVILLTLIIIVHRYLWRYGRPKDKNEVRPVIKDHVNTEQWTKDDLEIEWHQNGRKKASGKYINGCYDGLWTWWDEQGNKVSEETYSEGVAEGTRICWYSNGQMESKANFINGIIEGKIIMWHNNGQKKSEENWKDGAVLSLKEWDENGDEIKN